MRRGECGFRSTLGGFSVAVKSEMKHFERPESAEPAFGRSRGSLYLSVNLDETAEDFPSEDVCALSGLDRPRPLL